MAKAVPVVGERYELPGGVRHVPGGEPARLEDWATTRVGEGLHARLTARGKEGSAVGLAHQGDQP